MYTYRIKTRIISKVFFKHIFKIVLHKGMHEVVFDHLLLLDNSILYLTNQQKWQNSWVLNKVYSKSQRGEKHISDEFLLKVNVPTILVYSLKHMQLNI